MSPRGFAKAMKPVKLVLGSINFLLLFPIVSNYLTSKFALLKSIESEKKCPTIFALNI
jgi:hypothetical protein